jgi:hypothetical protein
MAGYWQIAAGAFGRSYPELFIDYGMAFVGGETQMSAMAQVEPGERVLLKRGRSRPLPNV